MEGQGEIGTLSRSDAEKVLRFHDIGTVAPVGSAELSASGNGRYRFRRWVARQVWNMLDYWPRKKAALEEVNERLK